LLTIDQTRIKGYTDSLYKTMETQNYWTIPLF
jgi:hypothetical protein